MKWRKLRGACNPLLLTADERWQLKQELAMPDRFYGDDGTIHQTTVLDVETYKGEVVSVWFRCQPIAFEQTEVDEDRATAMRVMPAPFVTGVQVSDD
jgi:hypothetical protein